MIRVGFTGTRVGMSKSQQQTLRSLWSSGLNDTEVWMHHGDCVGADAEAHDMAVAVGYKTAAHPPTEDRFRAFKKADVEYAPYAYLVRNKHIVDMVEQMFACPRGPHELHSGTWSTIRYARRIGKPITVIGPDGLVSRSILL